MKRPLIVVHLLASWCSLLVATGFTAAAELPAAAPVPSQMQSLFVESHGATTVHVSTSDQLIAAVIAANERHRLTIIRVAAGTYSFTQSFNSDFAASAVPPVTGRILIAGSDAVTTIIDGAESTTAAR